MQAYLTYYVDRFPNEAAKVVFATHRLEGKALRWFELTLKDFLENPEQDD
jgi:hypothetical protein